MDRAWDGDGSAWYIGLDFNQLETKYQKKDKEEATDSQKANLNAAYTQVVMSKKTNMKCEKLPMGASKQQGRRAMKVLLNP